LAKRFAKACRSREDGPLPNEIATVLYVLSIAAALAKCGCRITVADDQSLQYGLDWALEQPWIDAATRATLRQCREGMGPIESAPQPPQPVPQMSSAEIPAVQQLGEYRLLKELGRGGMGTVYKALHIQLDREVALKVMPEERLADREAVARFHREMKVVGRLDHPNIVRAYDAREVEGAHFLVMEYVDGMDFAELVRRLGPLPAADACELARQAAEGLAYAQQHQLVHRDIKPSNVMLNRRGQVKILDLGLARIRGDLRASIAVTTVGQVIGTPDYMAPEQFSDSRAVDIRADIYSLGCTLYTLLTGKPPFAGDVHLDPIDRMEAHLHDAVPPIEQLRSGLPAGLGSVIHRMVAKRPDERFAEPAEVAAAMAPFAAGADLPGLLTAAERGTPPASRNVADAPKDVPSDHRPESQPTVIRRHTPTPTGSQRRKRTIAKSVALLAAVLALTVVLAVILVIVYGKVTKPAGMLRAPSQGETDTVAGTLRLPSAGGAGQSPTPPAGIPDQPTNASQVRPLPPALTGNGIRSVPAALKTDAGTLGWIVLSWCRQGFGRADLWLCSPDGQRRIAVTRDPTTFDIHPSFSPDGRRIAFIRGTDLAQPTAVWICNVDGTGQRSLVAGRGESERLASPVWVSDSRIYYVRDPRRDRSPDVEVWRVDIAGGEPQRVFRFRDALGEDAGLLSDISPDGRQLLLAAQDAGVARTSDIYLADLDGSQARKLWADAADDRKDARPLWSPAGRLIAWQHAFAPSPETAESSDSVAQGVALARLGDDGQWQTQLPPDERATVIPLAWSPGGRLLLCARVDGGTPLADLFLMDDQFRAVRSLFRLDVRCWRTPQSDLGRLADWSVVPEDAVEH